MGLAPSTKFVARGRVVPTVRRTRQRVSTAINMTTAFALGSRAATSPTDRELQARLVAAYATAEPQLGEYARLLLGGTSPDTHQDTRSPRHGSEPPAAPAGAVDVAPVRCARCRGGAALQHEGDVSAGVRTDLLLGRGLNLDMVGQWLLVPGCTVDGDAGENRLHLAAIPCAARRLADLIHATLSPGGPGINTASVEGHIADTVTTKLAGLGRVWSEAVRQSWTATDTTAGLSGLQRGLLTVRSDPSATATLATICLYNTLKSPAVACS